MYLAETDPCAQWLQRAWGDLKVPLMDHQVEPAAEKADAERVQSLMQALDRGDLFTAHRICQHGHEPADPSLGLAVGMLLMAIECIEHEWQTRRRGDTEALYAYWNVQRLIQHWDEPPQAPLAPAGRRLLAQGRILLAAAPGSQHLLGAMVVADHFRAYEWNVQLLLGATSEELLQAAQDQPWDVIGLSVGHDAGLPPLVDLVRRLRRLTQRTCPRLLVGGNVFTLPVSAYDWLGVDGVAKSAEEALRMSENWVAAARP